MGTDSKRSRRDLRGAGEAQFFSSYAPHFSSPNTTGQPRRSLYLTYNALSEGDLHGGSPAISKIGHFRGKAVKK